MYADSVQKRKISNNFLSSEISPRRSLNDWTKEWNADNTLLNFDTCDELTGKFPLGSQGICYLASRGTFSPGNEASVGTTVHGQ